MPSADEIFDKVRDTLVDALGVDDDEVLPDEEAGHVEVMDHHVTEDATRALHVGGWRRRRIATDDGRHLDIADGAGAQAFFQRREVGIETAIEADH